jgi:phosphoribosylaminoimidazole carboxylase (NCAIR synthetase)
MPTVLLCTTTLGYQARAFDDAARRAGVTLRIVSDRCDHLDDPWGDGAIAARFDRDPEHVAPVLAALETTPVDGVLAVGDRPAWLAAHIARSRGLPWHAPESVAVATHKLQARGRLLAAGLPVPWFVSLPVSGDHDLDRLTRVRFPCVIKPVGLSASRGVMRADSLPELLAARERVAHLLARVEVRAAASADDDVVIVEGFVPGQEFALDGVLEQGALRVFALFEKPDPLDGPIFEETIYVTPARLAPARQHVIAGQIARAALALGLHHGPIHAECRVNGDDIVVLEVAPRPIGGLCARSIPVVAPDGTRCRLEDALLAHALGQSLDRYGHQALASGVLMVPVPETGRLRAVEGIDDVRGLEAVTAVEITAKIGSMLESLPEGGTYPGFVFAEGAQPDDVIDALREAARRLRLVVDRNVPISRG